ncbi:hypothetical protein SSS_02324, partial [Sarcoptes scabiei]
ILINEDRELLRNIFDCYDQFDKLDTIEISFFHRLLSMRFISLKLSFLVVLFCLLLKAIVDHHLFLIIVYILIIIFAVIVSKTSSSTVWTDQFQNLIDEINREKKISKRLKELLDDCCNPFSMENSKYLRLKKNFQEIASSCLLDFRNTSLSIKKEFPFKIEIDENLICSLPDDVYQSYINDDLNMKAINSLRQFVRLQISEFCKLTILMFLSDYRKECAQIDVFTIESFLRKTFRNLVENSILRQHQMEEIIKFHKSFYYQSNDNEPRSNFQPLESDNFWLAYRNLRKVVFALASVIDNCDDDFEKDYNRKNSDIESKLELLQDHLTSAQDCLVNLLKTYRHQQNAKKRDVNIENVINTSSCNDQSEILKKNVKSIEFENEPIVDQVFEAFVETNECDSNESCDSINDGIEIYLKTTRDAENNVFWELKTALKNKAIEHKIREAKALGLSYDREKIEKEYDSSIQTSRSSKMEIEMTDQKIIDSKYALNDSEKENQSKSLDFNFQLALKAHPMNGVFNLSEETFGDLDDDTDNESNLNLNQINETLTLAGKNEELFTANAL